MIITMQSSHNHKINPLSADANRHNSILTPARILCFSFLAVILVGTFLLCLPISSKTGTFTPIINSMFTATTSTCVTGLIVYDTFTHWSIFGQVVILMLIQVGGLGLVTLTTFFMLLFKQKIGLSNMTLAQESAGTDTLVNLYFLIKLVVLSTFTVEITGAVILATRFIPKYGTEGVWISVFTAISAYCNAGIDLLGREGQFSSLVNYVDDPIICITIMMLIIIGGLGFIVFQDVLSHKRHKTLMLHTKAVLFITALLIVGGAIFVFISEFTNPYTLKNLPMWQKIMASFFQSVTTRTAGFNTISQGDLRDPTKAISCILMFIGAAPGSTGGGIKCTTFMVLAMTVLSTLRNKTETTIMRRKVSHFVVYKSLTVATLGVMIVSIATSVLIIETGYNMLDCLFETISGFATVGLTTGITPTLGNFSKSALILCMYIGRCGSFSFVMAMTLRQAYIPKKLIIPEGQVFVG